MYIYIYTYVCVCVHARVCACMYIWEELRNVYIPNRAASRASKSARSTCKEPSRVAASVNVDVDVDIDLDIDR